MDTIFFLRLHFSEMIASFVMVLGSLLVWTALNKNKSAFTQKWQRNLVGGLLMFAVMYIGMFAGQALPSGHSWGSPLTAMALAMQHPWRVFHNDGGLLLIGILYVVFQLVGAILATGVYVVFIWVYNFSVAANDSKKIYLSKIFEFDKTSSFGVIAKDGLGAMIIAFAVIGASNFAQLPTGFPVPNSTSVHSTAFATGLAFMLIIGVMGPRGIITLNPFVWVGAFFIKFVSAFALDRKSITFKTMFREFMSPATVLVVASVIGLLIAGILTLPSK